MKSGINESAVDELDEMVLWELTRNARVSSTDLAKRFGSRRRQSITDSGDFGILVSGNRATLKST